MNRVLLLNSSYEPISIIGAERAIRLLFLGRVIVVVESDITWRSVSIAIRVPSVVRMVNYIKGLTSKKKMVKLTRKNIMIRDKYTCCYCGSKKSPEKLNIDHIVPRGQGGTTTWENVATSCVKCNTKKNCQTPKQAGMVLLKQPKKPDFMIFTLHRKYNQVPSEWMDYLYWNSELDS